MSTTVEHFRRIQRRFRPNQPKPGQVPVSIPDQRTKSGEPDLEEAALKSAISASLVVEYARHVLPPRSWN